jgi:hypothetical protein
VVSIVVWIPYFVIAFDSSFALYVWFGCGATINFMLLTKPDVKKYVKDFITMSYVFGDGTSTNNKAKTVGEGDRMAPSTTNETPRTNSFGPTPTTNEAPITDSMIIIPIQHPNRVTMFGSIFPGVDCDEVINVEAVTRVEGTLDINADTLGDCVDIASMVDNDDIITTIPIIAESTTISNCVENGTVEEGIGHKNKS